MNLKPYIISLLVVVLVGCSTAPYDRTASDTTRVLDSTARYGSIAAAAAGAGAVGYEFGGKTPAAAIAAGTAGGALMYAFNKYTDGKKQSAYNSGVEDGGKAVRAQILNDVWLRDAVYGNGKTGGGSGSQPGTPTIKRVYVPTREENGVILQGNYQEVETYK